MPLWLDCGFPVLSNMQAGHIVVCTLFVSVDKELTDEGLKVLFNIATKELCWSAELWYAGLWFSHGRKVIFSSYPRPLCIVWYSRSFQ